MEKKILFAQRLSALRKQTGLSQKQLGEVIGLSNKAICTMENGTRETSFERLILLADCFQVSTDFLLGLTDNPAGKPPEEGQAVRLAAYDRMYADFIKERDKVLADMERLRETKKQKGATYQQLLAQKLTLQNLISRFETYGIRLE